MCCQEAQWAACRSADRSPSPPSRKGSRAVASPFSELKAAYHGHEANIVRNLADTVGGCQGQNNVDKCSSLCADACASLFLWQLLGVVAVANPVASMPRRSLRRMRPQRPSSPTSPDARAYMGAGHSPSALKAVWCLSTFAHQRTWVLTQRSAPAGLWRAGGAVQRCHARVAPARIWEAAAGHSRSRRRRELAWYPELAGPDRSGSW